MLGVIKETRTARDKDEKAPGRCLLPSAALPCFSFAVPPEDNLCKKVRLCECPHVFRCEG